MGEENDIMWAIKTGDMDVVQTKLTTAIDANQRILGRGPLHYAADFGQIEVANFLIKLGADINAADNHGITPLLAAIYEGHTGIIKLLLEKNADKEIKGPDGKTPIESTESEAIKALLK